MTNVAVLQATQRRAGCHRLQVDNKGAQLRFSECGMALLEAALIDDIAQVEAARRWLACQNAVYEILERRGQTLLVGAALIADLEGSELT